MNKDKSDNLMEKVVSLCKRRGFIFPGSEIYGGLANSWDYGPLGVELKNSIKSLWWKKFVQSRDDMVGLSAGILMNPKVWEASGHLKEFSDPLVECKKCHTRFRINEAWSEEVWWSLATNLEESVKFQDKEKFVQDTLKECPNCGVKDQFTMPRQFNLMFKTFIGSAEGKSSEAYFRPETAQGIFVNFKNVLNTSRKKLPFGVAQIGKAFRNEITPGNFIFRTREFEQMEIEYFVHEKDWKKTFEMWLHEMKDWIKELGIDLKKVHEYEHPEKDLSHYSKRTVDFEYDFPFGRKELYGLAYRTDFDLRNHEKASGENLKYRDPETNEEFWPHVIEPSLGVDRTVLAVLLGAYDDSDPDRVVLKLKPELAPYKAAVFPLLANKPELTKMAREIYGDLRRDFSIAWDDRGNIGKRYFSQDEIGTPFCITVDFDSLEKKDVTVRDRDTAKQERVEIKNLREYLGKGVC
ncbi:MAG: glycyl-tRNA synthetase [Parcubacteria group bacterium Gr01-1014_20]|nr:MAG: glycyl-tRNA synthetase [Parcubacteria group bacterium Gr01-1014_20]